jgi:hypothetical protein
MISTRMGAIGVVAALFVVASLCRKEVSAGDADGLDAHARLVVDAAKGAFDAEITHYQTGKGSVEAIYRWSRRLMKAEVEAAKEEPLQRKAIQQHTARMLDLHRRVDALHTAGAAGGEEAVHHASVYYLAAAKRDLERWEAERR